MKDKQTRHDILQALRQPGKLVQGIIQEQVRLITLDPSKGVEVMTHDVSYAGVNVVIAVLSAGGLLKQIIDGLSPDGKDAAEEIRNTYPIPRKSVLTLRVSLLICLLICKMNSLSSWGNLAKSSSKKLLKTPY